MRQRPKFWDRPGSLPGAALAPLGALTAALGRLRWRLARPIRVPVPVICVGNLTVGGAGKTPTALALIGLLRDWGYQVHAVSRGYGGSLAGPARVDPDRHRADLVGDEPLLLARAAPTWVARDRAAGAEAAIRRGARVIVLDDGFQNPRLEKDLSLLVVDGTHGFGNGRVMPAGPLREPVEAGLARADALVLVGPDRAGVLAGLPRGLPVLRAWIDAVPPPPEIAQRPIVAFAGIAFPDKLFETLERLGLRVVERVRYPDHYGFADADIAFLRGLAADHDAALVTTTKDAVRLPAGARGGVYALDVALRFEDEEALRALLRGRLG